ncbi:CAP domain-containing protein [Halohasta salina]|uniref:CAP domain-containing protein n=1 Tax=Halohasta salina TaxID=2961621 RepID=UPI0020A2AB41|nr:CAP domain-containing protein [Halohasta salina]
MYRLIAVPVRIAVRLIVFYLVVIGLVATGGFAGMGPLADDLGGQPVPFVGASAGEITEAIAGTVGDSAGEFDGQPVTQNATVADEQAIERLIHAEVNAERTAAGRERLSTDDDLQRVARSHSADMIADGYVGHESPDGVTPADRLTAAGCRAGGENVAQSWIDEPVAVDGETIVAENESAVATHLVDRWMASPGHRENILRESFVESGVGVIVTENNRVYATQTFCTDSAGGVS